MIRKKIIIIAYVISGIMGALSGLVLSSQNQQASASQAKGYENDVLAASDYMKRHCRPV